MGAVGLALGCSVTMPAPAPSLPVAPQTEPNAARSPEPPKPIALVPIRAPIRATTFVDDEALSLAVTARVKTGSLPKSVAISPDGRQLWVCNFGYTGHKNVYVYDAGSLAQIGTVNFSGNAVEVGFAPDGARAYVSNFSRGVLEIVDVASFDVIAEVAVGRHPKVIAVAPDDGRVYVANWSDADVAVVDPDRAKVIERLETGYRPRGMAIDADGTLFVDAMWDHLVHVFAPSPSASTSFATCKYPRHAVLDPIDAALFVTCSGDDRLVWHDRHDGAVLGAVEVGDNPRSFGLTDDGRWAAVANFDASSVTLVDVHGGRRWTSPIAQTKQIVGLAVDHGPALRVFVTSWGNNQLIELGLETP